jgi:hypothetical protein
LEPLDPLEQELIRTLCAQLLACEDPAAVQTLAAELQAAIHDRIESLRQEIREVPATIYNPAA